MDRVALKYRYNALCQDIPTWVCCFTGDGSITFYNQRFRSHFKTARAENPNFLKLLGDAEQRGFQKKLDKLNKDHPVGATSFRYTHATGRQELVHCLVRKLDNENESAIEYQVLGKRSPAKTSAALLLDKLEDIVFHCKLDGTIKSINRSGARMLGHPTADALKNKSLFDFYLDTTQLPYFLEKLKRESYVKDFEVFIKNSQGKEIIGLKTAVLVRDNSNIPLAMKGVIRDVTARFHYEQRLSITNMELNDLNEKLQRSQAFLIQQEKMASVGQLAAGVAHEINNPLGFIKSNIKTLGRYVSTIKQFSRICFSYISAAAAKSDYSRERAGNSGEPVRLPGPNNHLVKEALNKPASPPHLLSEAQAEMDKLDIHYILEDAPTLLEESSAGIDRIMKIVKSLKSFSAIDSALKFENLNINGTIDEILLIAKKNYQQVADIERDFEDDITLTCLAVEMKQVFFNIFLNAVQAIESQKKTGKGKIKISTRKNPQHVMCRISDNGPGIPKAIRARIFDPFFTTKEVGKGSGLGLHFCYDTVVNKHGGVIKVSGESGEGTAFTVILPRKVPSKDAKPESAGYE